MTSRVVLNQAAINAWARGASAEALMAKLGAAVAEDARAAAPKDTGGMAASIDYEVGTDSRGTYVRVSFDDAHYYGFFNEVGTSKMSAHPFLRPAITKRRTL